MSVKRKREEDEANGEGDPAVKKQVPAEAEPVKQEPVKAEVAPQAEGTPVKADAPAAEGATTASPAATTAPADHATTSPAATNGDNKVRLRNFATHIAHFILESTVLIPLMSTCLLLTRSA